MARVRGADDRNRLRVLRVQRAQRVHHHRRRRGGEGDALAVELQSADFLSDWQGLFNRRHIVDVGRQYASVARNVDFFGSAIGKRSGTLMVNGFATLCLGDWANVAGKATGSVLSVTGFQVGDVVQVVTPPNGQPSVGGLTITAIVGQVVTLSTTLATLPVANTTFLAVRRGMGAQCDGIYHALFRDGRDALFAAAGSSLWNVWASAIGSSFLPAKLAETFPQTTVGSTWGGTTTGTLTSAATLVGTDFSTFGGPANTSLAQPDVIRIIHAGTVIYEGSIAHIVGNTITLTTNAASPPQAGDTVIFFPTRTPADTRFLMFNNRVFVTSAAAANPVFSGSVAATTQRVPPVVIEETAPGVFKVRRMGVRQPTSILGIGSTAAGVLTGTYSWRYTYVNTLNGQESEGSIVSPTTTLATQQQLVTNIIKSPDPQVTAIRLYRTLANQQGAWYFVTQMFNVDQSYGDNIPDTGLGPLMRSFYNETPPDTVTFLAHWTQAGALIGVDSGAIDQGGENIAFSDAPDLVNGVYKCESWPLNNTLFVARDDGDKLRSIGVFFDSVLIWKGRSTHRLLGVPPDLAVQPVSYRDDQTGIGILSAKGFIMDEDTAVFVSEDGFYQVDRYAGVQQGFTSTRLSRAIDQEWQVRTTAGASGAARPTIHMLYHRFTRRLQCFAPTDSGSRPNECFVYQMEGTVAGDPHGWSLWSPPIDWVGAVRPASNASYVTASCMVRPSTTGGILVDTPMYAMGDDGLVLGADIGAGDWQVQPVTFDYETTWFAPGGGGHPSRGRYIDAALIPVSPTTIAFVFGVDFAAQPTVVPVPVTVGASFVWGVTAWGAADWKVPSQQDLEVQRAVIFTLGEYHRIGIQETSVTGLFLLEDFTYHYQVLPVATAPRSIVQAL